MYADTLEHLEQIVKSSVLTERKVGFEKYFQIKFNYDLYYHYIGV